MSFNIGQTISHYRILEEIGAGGMAIVYKAEDINLKRLVALKFLPPQLTVNKETRKRFITEAQSDSSLDHPNICTIFEIGQSDDDQMFIPAINTSANTRETKKEIVRQVFINSILSSRSGRNLTSDMSNPISESVPIKPPVAIIAEAKPTSSVE